MLMRLGFGQVFVGDVLVDQLVQEGRDVIWTAVLKVQIMGVLPLIHGQDSGLAFGYRQFGVAGFFHF